ncbi:MAG: hypothetical protein HY708_04205 [Ignavibacteriae bacterium]|nr:hypothetical protein [Ignavibacteriota bacterium]
MIRNNNQHILLVGITTLCFLTSSCKQESVTVSPPDGRPIITAGDFGKVVLILSDYNLVRITHQLGLDLRSANVVRIGIGSKDSTGYTQSQSVAMTYDPNAQAYIIHFDFPARLDSSKAEEPLTLRYYLADSTYADADTTVESYKYPYPTAEVVVPFAVLQPFLRTHHLQDVDRNGLLVFFHPMGADGLFAFDMVTKTVTWLLEYWSGDHIAADSDFVFCDNHDRILRFNLKSSSVDLVIPGTGIPYDAVRGMDVYDGYLYIHRDHSRLRKYTLDGALLDSIDYWTSSYMTISDSIIYDVEFLPGRNNLRRYDMRTKSFLQKVLAPARATEGIKVYQDMLYYCDFERRMIGAVPLADLKPVK